MGSFNNQRFQRNNQNYNRNQRFDNRNRRFDRFYTNDRNRSAASGGQRSAGQFRGSNFDETNQNRNSNQSQNAEHTENQGFARRDTAYSGNNSNTVFSSPEPKAHKVSL